MSRIYSHYYRTFIIYKRKKYKSLPPPFMFYWNETLKTYLPI
jgi:hypothetical protein